MKEPKTATINMRVRSDILGIIDKAAHARGMNRSEFLRDVAEAEAVRVLSRPRLVSDAAKAAGPDEPEGDA